MKKSATVIALLIATSLCVPTLAHAAPSAGENDPWFARDKYLHGSVSAALAIGGYAAASFATPDPKLRLGVGAGLALSAGITKELLDLRGPGDASWRDLTWDFVGTASGLLLSWFVGTYAF